MLNQPIMFTAVCLAAVFTAFALGRSIMQFYQSITRREDD
jgi:hypothetical protein